MTSEAYIPTGWDEAEHKMWQERMNSSDDDSLIKQDLEELGL